MAAISSDRLSIASTAYTTSQTLPLDPNPKNSSTGAFIFPAYTRYGPFWTIQPNLTSRARQFEYWTEFLTSYCQHHKIFRLSLSSPPADLFTNKALSRSLKPSDIRTLLEYLAVPQNGAVIEWIAPAAKAEQSQACYVWWRSTQEWADALYNWVDETGQKGTVLTLYELRESDAVKGKEWREMEEEMLKKVLNALVKRGKAQIFGQEAGEGVKFF